MYSAAIFDGPDCQLLITVYPYSLRCMGYYVLDDFAAETDSARAPGGICLVFMDSWVRSALAMGYASVLPLESVFLSALAMGYASVLPLEAAFLSALPSAST